MKQPFVRYLFISLACVTFFTCKKIDVPEGTPLCVKNEIKSILKNDKRNPPAKVWQYTYNGQTVYYIPPYCCDIPSVLLNEKCDVICHPDGGLSGGGDGKCPDFFQNRTNEKLIWEDTR